MTVVICIPNSHMAILNCRFSYRFYLPFLLIIIGLMQKIIYILTWLVLTAIHTTMGQTAPPDPRPATQSDTVYLAPAWQKSGSLPLPVSFSVSATSLTTCISQPVSISLTIPERSLGSMLIFSVPQGDSIRSRLLSVPDRNGYFVLTTEATRPGQYAYSFILLTADTTITRSVIVEATPCSLSLVAPEYNCSTGDFTFRHMGGDTSAVSYMAVGITSWTTKPDALTVRPECDSRPFTLMARSNSDPTAITTFTWNYTLVCPDNCLPAPAPPTSATVAPVANPCASPDSTLGQPLQLLTPDYDCYSGRLIFRVTGGSGGQLSFMSPGITGWIDNCVTNIQSFALIADIRDPDIPVDPFTLFVKEVNEDGTVTMAQLRWDPKSACREGSARIAVSDSDQPLVIKISGNPVYGTVADVLLDGLQHEPVRLRVVSLQGQTISEQSFPAATGPVRTQIRTGQQAGVYLIEAFTPTRRKSIRVVKQ